MKSHQQLMQCMHWKAAELRCHATTLLLLMEAVYTGIANTPGQNLNSSSSSTELTGEKVKMGGLLIMT
uniref:Uncharacterized protein n=1 Tax=Anguilla anguilla TaxID=7936 RepID=A0A0E9VG23_ANGAN